MNAQKFIKIIKIVGGAIISIISILYLGGCSCIISSTSSGSSSHIELVPSLKADSSSVTNNMPQNP